MIIEVGQAIGVVPTLAMLLADAIARRDARRARRAGRRGERFNLALAEGRVPAREIFDGAMIIFGGALLLTPGFITDIVGLFLLIPPTRALMRRGLGGMARRRLTLRLASRLGAAGAAAAARPAPGPQSGYDYEGTAREVGESERELPRGPGA